jgi:ATP-dependent Zn protease
LLDDVSRHAQDVFEMVRKNVTEFGSRTMLRMMIFIASGVFLPAKQNNAKNVSNRTKRVGHRDI